MVSSCLKTRRQRLANVSVGTAVVEADADLVLRSFGSFLGLLLSLSDGGEMPRLSIWAFVNKLPQILDAASMPSTASDAVAIEKENGQIQQGRALSAVLLEATKLTRLLPSKCQSMISQICLIL